MKVFYLIVLALISFQSCSTSNDAAMDMMAEDMEMDENMTPSTGLFSGNFVSSAHVTTGVATINEAKTILKFTNFKTDNGPVLEVYLATDTTANNYISLGVLKGLDGNYEYDLPANIDYTVYNHVIIWCVEFNVNFGYAVLE